MSSRTALRGAIQLLLMLLLGAVASFAVDLPPGFVDTEIVRITPPRNFSQFSFSPDGTVFLADKDGRVWHFVNDVLIPLANLPVSDLGERGLNGLAVDPEFSANQHIWIYYGTEAPHRNRLSRFTVQPLALVDETVILEGPLVQDTDHNAGCLRFAEDGTLFVAMGDDKVDPTVARDPFDLRGKILHIRRDGTGAAGNPFADGLQGDPRVWAIGFRNPYRIALQPGTENVFVADVGLAAWEELDIGIAGGDFGWSLVEGPQPRGVSGMVYPIHAYSHEGSGAAIIGGDFVPAVGFGPRFAGDYLYHEFISRKLYRVALDEDNNVTEVDVFASDFGRATDMQFGPDGSLYYVCRTCDPSALRMLSYVGGPNTAPVGVATASADSGPAPLQVTLDGSASFDGEDDALTFDWNLGDGKTSDQAVVEVTYDTGVYLTELTVDDGVSGTDSAAQIRIVSGNSRPDATIDAPADQSAYVAGQWIDFLGSAQDAEEADLDCLRFTWQVVLHRSVGALPVLGPVQGACGGQLQVPTQGNADPGQFYRVLLTVDDNGLPLGADAVLTARDSIELRPTTATLSLATTPLPDLELRLDGDVVAPPVALESLVGSTRTVRAVDPQTGSDGKTYRWIDWSDGGEVEHTVSAPEGGAQLTAGFGCLPEEVTQLTVAQNGNMLDLQWDTPSAECLADGEARYRIYAASSPAPTQPPGTFPTDPGFVLVGTSAVEILSQPLGFGTSYFLVTASGPEGVEGSSGHYEF